jgi:hypothetical protein
MGEQLQTDDERVSTRRSILRSTAVASGGALVGLSGGTASAGSSKMKSTETVVAFSDGRDVGTSRLTRDDRSLRIRLDTSELTPGNVVTLWWVVFNNPGECDGGCGEPDLFDSDVAAACLYGGGTIVNDEGEATFVNRLPVGEERNSCLDFFGGTDHALQNPRSAEVHPVVRSHGPRIPGKVDEQRSSYSGGCTDFEEAGTEDLEKGECSDLQFAVHPSPSD